MRGEFLESLMRKLAIIPGLGFLRNWVIEVRGVQTRFNQQVGDLEAYRDAAREGVSDVAGAVGGGEGKGGPDGGFDEYDEESGRDGVLYGGEADYDEEDDYEDYDYDWDDYYR